jgi:hypothetical protein
MMSAIYQLSPEEIFSQFKTSAKGLKMEAVDVLQKKLGANILREPKKKSKLSILLSQFTDVMILILIIATVISFVAGEPTDAYVILAIILVNAWIFYSQEYNAEGVEILVPHTYKTTAITSILYTSDLIDLEGKLKKVVGFAKSLKATVELLHFTSPLEKMFDLETVEMVIKNRSKYDIKLDIENSNFVQSLVSIIESAVKKIKPTMIIMFTEQDRTLFERLFFSSKSAQYSYHPKIPLLVFNKS